MFDKQLVLRGVGLILAAFFALTLAACGDDDKDAKKKMDQDEKKPVVTEPKMREPVRTRGAPSASSSMDISILRTALRGVVNSSLVSSWVSSDAFVSEFVRLVVNINQNQVKQSLTDFNVFKPQPLKTMVINNKHYLGSNGFERYNQLARMVDALDAQSLVDLFGRSEQLMQAEYATFGIPSSRGNFKQQLKRAIDKVAVVKVSQDRIPLQKGSVVYKFESSSMENAGDLEKLMYRMGPQNSGLIQAKLKEISALM